MGACARPCDFRCYYIWRHRFCYLSRGVSKFTFDFIFGYIICPHVSFQFICIKFFFSWINWTMTSENLPKGQDWDTFWIIRCCKLKSRHWNININWIINQFCLDGLKMFNSNKLEKISDSDNCFSDNRALSIRDGLIGPIILSEPVVHLHMTKNMTKKNSLLSHASECRDPHTV